jgi:hypothetical protein
MGETTALVCWAVGRERGQPGVGGDANSVGDPIKNGP